MTMPENIPAVPARVRSAAYFVGLAVGGLTTLATGVVGAVAPEHTPAVLAVCGAVNGAVLVVLGGLGVVFRPTAGVPSASPARIPGDTWGDGTPVSEPVIGA